MSGKSGLGGVVCTEISLLEDVAEGRRTLRHVVGLADLRRRLDSV